MFGLPHFDKVLHFGYFFGGGGLLGAFLFYDRGFSPQRMFWVGIAVLAVVGVIDEYHQSFYRFRSGNDPFDWLADVIGGSVGLLTFLRWENWRTKSQP